MSRDDVRAVAYDYEYRHRNRDYNVRRQRAWHARNRELVPHPRRGHWTAAENAIVLRDDITPREMAVLLQRSYASVTNRRTALRRSSTGTCEHCGDEFPKIDPSPSGSSKPFHSRGKFCSKACFYEATKVVTKQQNMRPCLQCGAEYTSPARVGKYCTQTCFGAAMTTRVPIPCPECSTPFKQQMTHNTRAGRVLTRYCSMACAGAVKRRSTQARRTRDCEVCGDEFVADNGTRHCSRRCAGIAHRSIPEKVCETCGVRFRKRARYCSMACRRGVRMQDCEHCGQRYERHQPGQRFCSHACSTQARPAAPTKRCKTCGEPRRGTRFCSLACRRASVPERACETCGVSFSRKDQRGRPARFCCSACQVEATMRDCVECGKQFKRHDADHRFCSRSCASKGRAIGGSSSGDQATTDQVEGEDDGRRPHEERDGRNAHPRG